MDSELTPDIGEGDRIFGHSNFYFVGAVLAPRFLREFVAQDFSAEFTSTFAGSFGNGNYRSGGLLMLLKLFVLSGSAIVLWLVPLTVLDKKVGWHKSVQGLSLMAAVSCAIGAGNIARKLTEENEIEELKTRAITADVVDEIATSAYISQAQRQQEAEQILSGQPEREEAVEALKRAWLLDCGDEPSEPAREPLNQPKDNASAVDEERFTNLNLTKNQAIELIQKMRSELNQTQTIEKLWECKKGGSEAWKRAYAQFKNLMEEGG